MDSLQLAPAPLPKTAMPPAGSSAARTKQAAQDFEAVFISQMLTPMFNTVEIDPEFGGGNAEETWRGVMVEEMGKQIARSGGIGIAPVVEQEMLKMQEVSHGTHD